jgi:hypothetical protein
MKKNEDFSNRFLASVGGEGRNNPEGYPEYPDNEDIYLKCKKEKGIDPEYIPRIKETEIIGDETEKDFDDYVTESDPEIMGLEPDEEDEITEPDDDNTDFLSTDEEDLVNFEDNL